MRHSALSLVFVFVGCTAAGSDDRTHGPTYNLDASTEGGGDAQSDGHADSGNPPVDGGTTDDSAVEDTGVDACAGTVAVLAGSDTSLFGATYNASWQVSSIAGGAARHLPALVAFGSGFQGVTAGAEAGGVDAGYGVALQSVSFGASWSAATAIGSALTRDSPAIAVLGGSIHLVALDPTYKFIHGTFNGTTWDGATDPVGGAGLLQSFGPSAASAAVTAGDLVIVFNGDGYDGGTGALHDQAWHGSSWQTDHVHTRQALWNASPALVALGTMSDLLAVYVATDAEHHLTFELRASGTWSPPTVVDPTAETNVQMSLAALSGSTRAVLTYMGQDDYPYFSIGTITGATIAWSVPAPLVSGSNPKVTSTPVVTAGVCGDDAIAVFTPASGDAQATRLCGTTWSAPEAIAGTAGAKYAAVATR